MGNLIGALFFLSVWAVGVIGWVWNIVKVVNVCCAAVDGILVIRIAGIFVAPLGSVMGYL